jgi:predicted ATPase
VLAEPNTFLADAATFQAANGAIEFADFGQHALKGFSDPVQVWQALRARALPSRFAKRTRLTKLCGRDPEVRRLMRSWEEVSIMGEGQVVVISGEAGIGKSRLLNELQRRLQTSTQLMVQCSPAFVNSTLYPFMTMLKRQAGIEDTDAVDDKIRKLQSVLSISEIPTSTALPIFANLLSISIAGPDAVSDISFERQRIITKQVFTDWIGSLARTNPVLLLFEDEQWADLTSRELLEALIKNLPSIPALILVSKRTESEAAQSEREDSFQLRLNRLKPEDARALIRDMNPGDPPSDEMVAFVLDRAEGVPLYIEELTRSALETGLPIDPSMSKHR